MTLKEIIPFFSWIKTYNKRFLASDLMAGLTVGVMLVPQGMAYAMIAGLPPIYGLYASIVPLIIYAFLGTSRHLAVGPVAMVSLLIAAGVGQLANQETEQYIALAISLALLVGLIQVAMGIFRLGFLVKFLSHPVISGFTSAAALIIGFSQLKHLLGIDIERSHHIHEILISAIQNFSDINWVTLGIGIGGILTIIILKKIHKSIPSAMIVVAIGILIVYFFELTNLGVTIVGDVPKGLPIFGVPEFSSDTIINLLPMALTIVIISFVESIAIAKAIQSKHKNYEIIPNQELIALGAANVGGAFFQAFPTTGGLSRTAVNDQAGAKTGMASIFSAVLIGLTLLFLTPLFFFLPTSLLAAIIMVAVFGLIDTKQVRYLWKADRRDLVMLLVTFFATLSLGIETGILIGVVLSLGMVIYQSTKPHIAVLGQVPGTEYYRNINRFKELKVREDVLIFRFDAHLYFANADYFKKSLNQKILNKGDNLRLTILDTDSINHIDSSGLHTLEEIWDDMQNRNIAFYFTSMKGPVRDILYKSGLSQKMGDGCFFMTINDALVYFDEKRDPNTNKYTMQTNAIKAT
ncbi:MAG: solute carrier family 26 protein [Bacteroidota bacterium]